MEKLDPAKEFFQKVFRHWWAVLLAGIVIAALLFVGLRAIFYKPDAVHYHANFALYINDQQDEFKSFTFYEEIAACSVDGHTDPKTRVHMHDENNHLIHVHDHGVTWSQFFTNLGYTLGDNIIATDSGVYVNGQDGKKLTFMLNGQVTEHIADEVINSEDVLLIDYGTTDPATLMQRYNKIPRDAHKANITADPSTCSGSKPLTLSERLRHAVDPTQ